MLDNPFALFNDWMSAAESSGVLEPNAMVVATTNKEGQPSARVVLLKKILNEGFYFFTNYESRKAKQIEQSPFAALVFHWREPFHRQVRIEGSILKATREVSEDYFKTRPRGSQIGAWASPQSHSISHRDELLKRVQEMEERFAGKEIPCPEFWGGYEVRPMRFEFWQAGDDRLHTRWRFLKTESGWEKQLVAP